ncbi:PREDICTED: uncharacterized protein LOC109205431 [Nicotiana attenuata]|uniref:Uncharacterized protein n=1 Tax=Nicotiana attenuata TaxID=49451 RepID=A0A314KYS1_NICAT|nr:PREDICTED: uncharacterized protein LOC109205431 [Nicotiana attenuata]OIT33889.1 hypothetical protein A4A49_05101 [Nicotiana attenuata]
MGKRTRIPTQKMIGARESCKQAIKMTKKRGNQVNQDIVENRSNCQNLKMANDEGEIEQIRGKEKEENKKETPCRIELPSQLEIDSAIEAMSNGTLMVGKDKVVEKVEKLKTAVQEWEEGT